MSSNENIHTRIWLSSYPKVVVLAIFALALLTIAGWWPRSWRSEYSQLDLSRGAVERTMLSGYQEIAQVEPAI